MNVKIIKPDKNETYIWWTHNIYSGKKLSSLFLVVLSHDERYVLGSGSNKDILEKRIKLKDRLFISTYNAVALLQLLHNDELYCLIKPST